MWETKKVIVLLLQIIGFLAMVYLLAWIGVEVDRMYINGLINK